MAKQLNVNLGFTADTAQAKMQIQDLQMSLNSLVQGSIASKDLPITKELTEAQSAAAALKVALDSAINTQTGKLDLSRFSESINKAGLDLKSLQGHLQALGPAGTQTFQSLASSIMQAEIPLTRSNMLVTQLWTTLKNTARWQLSSSMLHGFMSTIQGAVGYAQDLNESLNNIRIVTGASVEEMARFAEQANRSAKALNATTTEYTNASLIYYQQGLSADEVQKRTDVTIKMANVSRQSAETVSEQLTAVWNNFYDGTQSLESFADKMVALGAATASSSDEIAGGLEKFAAIGDTIGLSFDYAASALATITANTRQSEEVVGTALKTIFARIQGLKMGETLEDGLELNKYSEALQAVGISIFEQNGELKNMDNILDEMGSKWETLTKAQQVALAQTVAGVRQYNQLISLMDNWDNGDNDSFQANLDTTRNADGALQEQADIYAESWEAARDRVKTSAQDIYDSLLNDDFFISLLDGFAGLLDLIGTFVDSLGGLRGVLALVGTIMTKVFGEQMAASIERLVYNVKSLTGANQRAAQKLQEEAYQRASTMHYDDGTETGAATADAMKSQLDLQNSLIGQSSKMTEQERQRYQLLLDTNKAYGEQVIAAAKVADAAQQAVQNSNRDLRREAIRNGTDREDYDEARGKMKRKAQNVVAADNNVRKINKELQGKDVLNYTGYIEKLNKALSSLGKTNATANAIKKLNSDFKNGKMDSEEYKRRLNELATSGELVDDAVMDMSDAFRTSVPSLQNATTAVDNMAQQEIDAVVANNNLSQSQNALSANTNNVKIAIEGFKAAMSGYATTVVSAFNGISQLTMGISSIKGMIDTLNNTDMTFGEKFLSVTMSLSMAIPALIGGYQALFVAQEGHNASVMKSLALGAKDILIKGGQAVAAGALNIATHLIAAAKGVETGAVVINTAAWYANPIMWIALVIMAVVAAITLLVTWLIKSSEAQNADAMAAKKAAQTAEELSAAYDECASAYQEMIDTMSEYEEARKSLDQLVEGTDEYKAALQEANRAALELIQNNPGKFEAGKDYNWVGDELVLSEDAMKRAKSDGKKQLTTMYGAKQVGAAKADVAQAKADTTEAAGDIWQNVDTYYNEKSVYEDLFEQANELYKQNQNLYSNKDYMAEQLGLDASDTADQELIDALWENKDQMIELGNATKAAADSYTLATEAAVRELLGENEDVQNSENKEEIITKSKYNFDKEYDKEMDKLDRWGKDGIAQIDSVNDEVRKVWKEYTQAAGLEGTQVIDTTGDDSNRVFVYTDSEGNEKKVGLDTMKEVVATSRANKTVDASATQMAESVEKLNNIIKENRGTGDKDKEAKADATEAAKNFALNDNFNKSSKGDLKDLKAARDAAGGTEAYLDKLFGDGKDGKISDQTAKNFGYDSAQAMVDAFNKKLGEAEKNWEALKPPGDMLVPEDVSMEAMNKMTNQYEEISKGGTEANLDKIFGDGKDGKISDDTAKKYGYDSAQAMVDAFNEAIANGTSGDLIDKLIGDGKDGKISDETAKKYGYDSAQAMMNAFNEGFANESMADAFSQNINTILGTIDPSKQSEAFEALANIDWSSWDASEQAIEALDAIGANSEGTTEAINLLTDSMRELNGATKNLDDLNTALDEDIDTGEYEALAKHLKSVAKESKDLSKDLAYNEKAAKKVSEAILRFDNAIQDVNDNYEDWAHTLKSGSLQDQAKVAEQLGDAYADMLDIDVGSLSNDFIMNANNLELMKQAANGSEEAYKQLQAAAAEDILMQCGVTMDDTEFWNKKAALDAQLAGLNFQDLEIGASLNDAQALQAMTDLVNAAGMTAQQATDYLASMGVDAEVETVETEEPVERTVNNLTPTVTYKDASIPVVAGDGAVENQSVKVPQISYKAEGQTITDTVAGGGVALKVTSATKSSGGNFKFKNSSHGGGVNGPSGPKNSGGGGGGGGDKPSKPTKAKTVKPTEKKDKDDEIERYKEITEVLDDLNNELDEIGKAKEEAWGPNKIAAMDKELGKLNDIVKAQKTYINQIGQIDKNGNAIGGKLKVDQDAVKALGGVFDEFGRLTNYEELMGSLVDTWNSTQSALDTREQNYENSVADVANTEYAEGQESQQWAAEDANEAEKDAIDTAREDADKAYEDGKKAIEQYMETLNLSEEAQRQLEDYLRQIKELNYEKLMYKVEFKVEVNDRELAILDHYIGRMEDDFYKTAEVMAKIQEKSKFYESGDVGILDDLKTAVDELETSFKNGEITQADYIEGLGEIQDMAMDNVDALYEMNSQMKEYYADVIDEGISKIQEMTSHFDHLTSKLQHYSSILSLMGHEQNYELQNNLLQSQIDVLNDKIETSKATMAMLDSSLKSAQANYENATSEEDKEYWRERIVQISQALNEEEDAYLSYVEEVGDAANQILTNSIEKAFKEAELSMTNNLGFDSILADMERMNTLTDEFLTNTNKMYETNKMISSAQLAIDKTQNAQAKQKYQDYIKYIEQLQVSGNLTQTELQTAQARYKVLEAEIALEEAKNAKSEVRLTRDSEGNFGYVYTANQDEVANATQNYLDAQNELYNVGLENTKAYREKTVQLQQSTLEELKQLEIDFRVDHIISEEQYNQQKAAILETSNALLETYTEQFNLAQFTMATTSYNALMESDTNFYNGQLSRNKEHTSLMEANDAEYYNGIKTTAETTQTTLETNLDNFNAGVLSKEETQYLTRSGKDTKYYTSLRDLADGTADEIDGIFNTDEDSLSYKLKEEFYNNLNTALGNCEDATTAWQINMQPLVEAVGVSFDGSETGDEGLTQKIANTLQESKDLKDYITGEDGLIKGIEKEWEAVEDATLKWQAHWDKIQEVIGAYDELIGRTQQLIQAQAGPIANEPQPPEDPNANSGDGGSGGGSGGGSDGGTNAVETQASTLASQAMEIVQKVHNGTIKQDSSGWRNNAKAAGYSDDAIALALKAFNDSKAGGGYSYYYDKALELVQSYDTGGYTGEWGPEGRMAMLHEKELVLNAKDTENFLTATSMLREISQMLDNNALLASLGMINLSAMTLSTEADKVLQQEVTIHADFPNVTDHNEIEMAIDNLINAASQYANKK